MQSSLQILHAEYHELARSTRSITADQRVGLRFYSEELRLLENGQWRRPSRSRIGTWASRVIDLSEFVNDLKRIPRENNRLPAGLISERERTLAEWVKFQRRAATRALHVEYQTRRLSAIDGFSFDPLSDQWQAQLIAFSEFVRLHGRPPRYRSVEASERRLARWAEEQHRSFEARRMSEARMESLRSSRIFDWIR